MKQMIDLTNRKILITGASSGIGRATAVLLSQLGARLVLVARREEQLQKTLSLMDNPSDHCYIVADLMQIDEIGQVVRDAVEKDGQKLNGLVHSAGIARTVPLNMIDYQQQDACMRVNYYAFVELVRLLARKKYGGEELSLVGISSVASYRGGKGQTVYSASKAAMDAAITVLSKELGERKIRINSIQPGMMRTAMADGFARQTGMDQIDEMEDALLMGLGEPEDVARTAAFLLSPAAGFITGQNIPVDGGGLKTKWF